MPGAMVSHDQVRALALSLDGVLEQDHHGRPSFRVAGRILATLWDESHLNVMLDESGIRTAVRDEPALCEEFWWGKRLRAVHVDLDQADEALVGDLLADAWEQKAPRRLRTAAAPVAAGSRISARALTLARDFLLGEDDLRAWEQSGLGDEAFDDWLTDRVARRPAGRRARDTYGAADVHAFARRAILDALRPATGDRLLDIGCGGGLLLRDAQARGASVTGLDHSADMVNLARERAPGATVVLGSAEQLPFPADRFEAVAMANVFFFLTDPLAVLRECHRVLAPDGLLAVYTPSPSLRGTPAAPEPLASRSYFYADDELGALARRAGYAQVTVRDDDGGQLLTASA